MLLDEMEIFYQVVEQGSFSKAAEILGVSKSFISKKITQLEKHLKTRLVTRNTRKLVLTEEGKSFFTYCRNVVAEARKGFSMIDELHGVPSGLLRISMPPALAMNLIGPILPRYLAQYPKVTLDIELESHVVDIVKEGYDLALRAANLESSNLISQKICTIENIICASPKYIDRYGLPNSADDLQQHNFAIFSKSKSIGHIKLKKNQDTIDVRVQGNFMSNQLDLIKQLVINGTCLGVLPRFMLTEELATNKVIQCLTSYTLPSNNLYAIYPEREFMLPKVSAFIEIVKQSLLFKGADSAS